MLSNIHRKFDDFYYLIKNVFFSKYYLIDTKLDRTRYYDIDERMLFGNFALLVSFVEIELASMYDCIDRKNIKHYSNAKKGLLYCQDFFENVEYPEYFDENYTNKLNKIKNFYREVYELYNWWVYTRPIRISSSDLSGIDAYRSIFPLSDRTDSDGYWDCCRKMYDIDEKYDNEDQDMLERLIKIRRQMWT